MANAKSKALKNKKQPGIREAAQEWMGVTLAVTHSIGDMEPEEATSYSSQARTPVEQ
jgi:molybdopterin synthase catalytic subunit